MKANLSISNSKSAKPFLLKLCLFMLLLVAADFVVGSVLQYLHKRVPYGVNWTQTNWLLSEPRDVVILGSSRAFRHYVPEAISKKLDTRVFNAGQNGQYLLYSFAVEQLLLDQYTPKVIVLDLLPSFIVKMDNPQEEFDRLETLSPYYHHPAVRKLLTRDRFYEKVKYASKVYRYNSKIFTILANMRSESNHYDNGFEPVGKVRFHKKNPFIVDQMPHMEFDPYKLNILDQFVTSAQKKGVKVVFAFSPVSQPLSENCQTVITHVQKIADSHHIPFINFAEPEFADFMNPDYFMDYIHMDEPGARLFSESFADQLQPIYSTLVAQSNQSGQSANEF